MKTVCPHCGAPLQPRAIACPECGSDEQTGWGSAGSSDLPQIEPLDDEGYNEIYEREFGTGASKQSRVGSSSKQIAWTAIAVILLLLMAYGVLR